ncbi:MAG: hypothetical protein GY931_19450 [Maribacter sp.]|nr:hypothetical protein [Maribacter sp.]
MTHWTRDEINDILVNHLNLDGLRFNQDKEGEYEKLLDIKEKILNDIDELVLDKLLDEQEETEELLDIAETKVGHFEDIHDPFIEYHNKTLANL